MKVSIITPVLNAAESIGLTLESVKYQSYGNIEHIVVDGKSKDDTLAIIAKYATHSPNLRILSEIDTGIYNAINKGIAMASGEVIAILNAGDVYNSTEIINKIVGTFGKEKVDSIYGDLVYVKKNNYKKIVRYWESGSYNRDNFYRGWMPPHPSFFVRKIVVERLGQYNESLNISSDYEFMLRLLFKEKISTYYIPRVMVSMPEGGKSNKSIKNRIIANMEDRRAWRINDLFPKRYTLFRKPFSKISQLYKRPFLSKSEKVNFSYEFFEEASS